MAVTVCKEKTATGSGTFLSTAASALTGWNHDKPTSEL